MLTAIRQWVIRTMMKSKGETGIVQTMPKRDLVEINTQITAQKLMQNGIDPEALKNANQVENAIIAIENKQKANLAENIRGGIGDTKSAKIFNTAGEELDPNQPIIGGTQPGKKIDTDAFIRNAEAQELETKIQKKLEKSNKEAAQRLREKSIEKFEKDQDLTELDKAIDNASPGFVKGDMKYNAQLVADDLAADRFGKDFYDLDQKQQIKLYDEAYTALSKQRFQQKETKRIMDDMKEIEDPEDMAQGGRAGFKDGLSPAMQKRMMELLMQGVPMDKVQKEAESQLRQEEFRSKAGPLLEAAKGGIARLGLKEGSGMTRRTFLKILGGAMSIPIVGKILKPLKLATGVKKVPIIKTEDVAGKPEWFDALVNKVIIEGDDVTKKFATGERQSIHQKTLDDGSVVRVTEDVDDGAVRVEYESEQNVFGDPVQLQYKKPLPDEGDPRPAAEFTTAESGPVGRSYGPDDYDIDVDEVGGTSIRDLDSDVSKLKQYATGKNPTMKEIVESKKRRDRAKQITEDPEAQSDAVIRRQGDADDSYYGDPGEFASGGIARMLGE